MLENKHNWFRGISYNLLYISNNTSNNAPLKNNSSNSSRHTIMHLLVQPGILKVCF